eukprot:4343801-Pleurochrysis_carterae.AAC.4
MGNTAFVERSAVYTATLAAFSSKLGLCLLCWGQHQRTPGLLTRAHFHTVASSTAHAHNFSRACVRRIARAYSFDLENS